MYKLTALQIYIEILKKIEKSNNSEKNVRKCEKTVLRNSCKYTPKFQSSTSNGVAKIERNNTQIYLHTYIHIYCRTLVIPKKNIFAVIDKSIVMMRGKSPHS